MVAAHDRFSVGRDIGGFEGFHNTGHGEFHGGSVDNTDNVTTSRGLDDSEERTVHTIFCVEFDHLLVVVGTLQELDTGIERTAISSQSDGNRVNHRVERVGTKSSTLDDAGLTHLGHVVLGVDGGLHGELHLTNVANGHSVRSTGSLDDGSKRTDTSIFQVDTHLVRSVIGTLPQFNVRIERTSFSGEEDFNTFDGGVQEGPGLKGSSLDGDLVLLCVASFGALGHASDIGLRFTRTRSSNSGGPRGSSLHEGRLKGGALALRSLEHEARSLGGHKGHESANRDLHGLSTKRIQI